MVKAAIIGASGYSGLELLRLLMSHPRVTVSLVTSASFNGKRIDSLYPSLLGVTDLRLSAYEPDTAAAADIVFTALPHGTAAPIVAELVERDTKVIDLSADLRLPAAVFSKWYKAPHPAPELIDRAVYGLSEVNRALLPAADLVANPGCYPTSVALPLLPLLQADYLVPDIVVNSLSGVSGAGRRVQEAVHFCRLDNNVVPYKAGGVHQHIPEMEQVLKTSGRDARLTFTPHLAPFSRGIFSNIYAGLKDKNTEAETLRRALRDFYVDSPFVQITPAGELPQLKSVVGSNYCQIGLEVDRRTGKVIIVSVIDNLVKGAAGQAVQNMNLMWGWEETLGLTTAGPWP